MLTLAEPDWDALAIDHPDLAVSRAFTRYVARRVNRNPAIGRQLPRLAADAGYTLRAVGNAAAVLTDFGTAETVLGLRRNTERAVAAGYLTAGDAHVWFEHLTTGTSSPPRHLSRWWRSPRPKTASLPPSRGDRGGGAPCRN